MKKPVIGISLDHEGPGGYSPMPWYALRENYSTAVARHGGIPLMLPHEVALAEEYLDIIDGLIIAGGNFDIDPTHYGDDTRHATVMVKDRRTQFEMAVTKGALEREMPVMGICGGEQLLNVILGGTLIQHIPDSIANALEHEQPNPRTEPGHSVTVTKDTLLYRIVQDGHMEVNTTHHQAVAKIAPGMVVNAVAPDGVIEGIEYPAHPFCLGLQWHPEYEVTEKDSLIFQAFIKAASV